MEQDVEKENSVTQVNATSTEEVVFAASNNTAEICANSNEAVHTQLVTAERIDMVLEPEENYTKVATEVSFLAVTNTHTQPTSLLEMTTLSEASSRIQISSDTGIDEENNILEFKFTVVDFDEE